MRARVSAPGPTGLSPAAPLKVYARGGDLVVAALLLLLEFSGGATDLSEALQAQGEAPRALAIPSRWADLGQWI